MGRIETWIKFLGKDTEITILSGTTSERRTQSQLLDFGLHSQLGIKTNMALLVGPFCFI